MPARISHRFDYLRALLNNAPTRLRHYLGPYAAIAAFAVACLVIFACNRIALAWQYWPQINTTQDLWRGLIAGARVDAIAIADVLFIPTLVVTFTPRPPLWLRQGLNLYFAFFGALFLFFEIASWPFFAEFQSRPNHLMVMYLNHPVEVLQMVFGNFALLTIGGTIAVVAIGYSIFRIANALHFHASAWQWPLRIAALPLILLSLFIAARSGIGEATANPSLAAFSNNYMANQLALNATYSVAFAAYLQHDDAIEVQQRYGRLARADIIARVRRDMGLPTDAYVDALRPTMHIQNLGANNTHPPHVVIIIEESLGSHLIGALGGAPVSPNFDALSKQGAFFTQMYATGERTYRGLEAVTAGYPPIDHATTVLRQPLAQHNFFTLGTLFKRQHYYTSFLYGGEGHFDNMAGFYLANGFERMLDKRDFSNPIYNGTWGVSDEDLFAKLDEQLMNAGDVPTFIVALTLSNHRPFDFPQGKIDLYEQPPNTTFNTAKYADYALGKFFESARGKPYFAHTLFLIVADHQWRADPAPVFPLHEFHIPALLLGPGVAPRAIDTLGSQIDLPVTLLSAAGIELTHPMIGRDLLHDRRPGRALMEHGDTFAYWQGDKVIVMPAYKPATQYRLDKAELRPMPLEVPFYHDALAQLLVGNLLYQEKLYDLPDTINDACTFKPKGSNAF